jgi:monoamine oxidase
LTAREAPWAAKKAEKWDRMTLAQWLAKNVASKAAHDLLDAAISGCYTSAASEVSMLFMLYQMGSAGGPNFVLGRQGRIAGCSGRGRNGRDLEPVAAALGDAVQLSQPVRYITQDADGVTVRSEGQSVRARRVIVAVPLAIAGQIIYEPMLPTDRSFLHQRMPSGSIVKISIVYDEPFWRADGLCGQSATPGSLATVTIDACPDTGTPGILCVVIEGPIARQYDRLDEGERRQGVLDALVERFGPKAGKPVDYVEQNWSRERYSGGGMISHAPPGVPTEFGDALRTPCGRIHWAGTESSTRMCGWIDGAIRSGERAATEVMANQALAAM